MKINKKYIMTFYLFGKTLTFTGTVLEINDFVKFKDKFDQILYYNKNCLISYKEVMEDEK